FYTRMLVGPNSVVENINYKLDVAELSVLHGGNTAISWGTLGDHYKLRDGTDVTMNSRWTATAVKEGDRWLLASYHASVGLFDKEVLRVAVKKTMYMFGGISLAVGLVVGLVVGMIIGKKRQVAA